MKRMSWFFGSVVVGVMALTGCSQEEAKAPKTASTKGNLTVQGSVSSKLGTDNARAVAIDEKGKKIWTFLDSHGDFSLKLPAGKSYRVVIANQLAGGGQKVIGKLAVKNGSKATDVIEAKKSGKIDLGVLRKPEVKSTDVAADTSDVKTKALHIDCGCSEGGGDDWGGGGGGYDMGGGGGDGGWGDDGGWGSGGGWDDGGGYNMGGGGDSWGGGGDSWGGGGDSWGGNGGWESDWDQGGWDPGAGGWDTGSEDMGGFDHDDDNGCFGDDGSMFDDESGEWGQGGGFGDFDPGADGDMGGFDPCNICVAGDPVDLVPSKGGYNDFVGLNSKMAAFEGEDCSSIANNTTTTTAATTTTTSSSSSSGSTSTLKAFAADDSATKKSVGQTCSTKQDVDTSVNACVAGKVVKK